MFMFRCIFQLSVIRRRPESTRPPAGYAFLADDNGALLTDDDGALILVKA